MQVIIALITGLLIGAGIYRLLGGAKIDIIIGLILISQGGNLIIFASGGLKHNAPALLTDEATNAASMADPLPQALVLTAIVIGFGILAFLLTLLTRSSKA
ncbi:sodium:proton antiporter [Sulfuriroseicoccus oceanibius]|uniref:NADH-quinone oxidoreductase subunit K n=1 Tax=Sulfuriroseicoccus oceanibius TaxID=2707525 RepID=A0A6B3LAQ0_9BACT|nr:NADH-quinone oxidoreductase subunit K [Sulfuriroseicoccus oceanibius]QQL45573.1 NADH-quinone oxidoreductase subunit K [Sulfuriroseicoccus oceanibius]